MNEDRVQRKHLVLERSLPIFLRDRSAEAGSGLENYIKSSDYGWGMIPVEVRIGKTRWRTSLWPKDGSYIVPIKASVRKAENLAEGETVTVRLEVG